MPSGGGFDFEGCILKVTGQGHSKESAERICGAAKAKNEGNYEEVKKLSEAEQAIVTEIEKYGQEMETVTIEDVEIFKAGTWNGDSYKMEDLDSMVVNFDSLGDRIKPPVKIGHGEDQGYLKKEGLPAAGWVTKLKRVGDTLKATFSDVPKRIADLIKKKAYRRVSSEIYPEYKTQGANFRNVLRAVAILGGDIPAVETLKDIEALYLSQKADSATVWRLFELDDFNKKGGDKMDYEKEYKMLKEQHDGLQKKFGELETELKKLKESDKDAELGKLQEENKKLNEEIKKLGCDKSASDEELKKKKDEADKFQKLAEESQKKYSEHLEADRKAEINTIIGGAIKEGRLLPKSEPAIRALMERADGTKLVKFSQKVDGKDVEKELSEYDLVKNYVATLPIIVKFAEISADGHYEQGSPDTINTDASGKPVVVEDRELAEEAKKYAEEKKIPYGEALIHVSQAKQAK